MAVCELNIYKYVCIVYVLRCERTHTQLNENKTKKTQRNKNNTRTTGKWIKINDKWVFELNWIEETSQKWEANGKRQLNNIKKNVWYMLTFWPRNASFFFFFFVYSCVYVCVFVRCWWCCFVFFFFTSFFSGWVFGFWFVFLSLILLPSQSISHNCINETSPKFSEVKYRKGKNQIE